jgi:hypothetical protein
VNRQDADRQQVYREALAVERAQARAAKTKSSSWSAHLQEIERHLESCLSPTTYQVLS